MAGIIHRGSLEHKAHLKGLEIDNELAKVKAKAEKTPEIKPPASKEDPNIGPTVGQFVEAGYDPRNYPPTGFNSRSTPEEIAKAIVDYKPKMPKPASTPPKTKVEATE